MGQSGNSILRRRSAGRWPKDPVPAGLDCGETVAGPREPGRTITGFLAAIATLAVCASVAPDAVRAQDVDSPLTQQQFDDYEQGAAVGLGDSDLQYLADNQIRIPNELSPAQLGGLHRVVSDPKTQKDPATRKMQVDYYLNLAVKQTIQCAINPRGANCDKAR